MNEYCAECRKVCGVCSDWYHVQSEKLGEWFEVISDMIGIHID